MTSPKTKPRTAIDGRGWIVATAVLAASCGPDVTVPTVVDGIETGIVPLPEAGTLGSLPVAGLREGYARAERAARRFAATVEGVQASRSAARYAVELARRREQGFDAATAKRHLEEASRRRRFEGACEASVELAELLARTFATRPEAYWVAYQASRRFRAPDLRPCVQGALSLLGTLADARPTPDVLAEAEVDLDADDPSLGTHLVRLGAGDEPSGRPDSSAASSWLRARALASGAVIDDVSVLGDRSEVGEGIHALRVVLTLDHVAAFRRADVSAEDGMPRRMVLDVEGARLGARVPAGIRLGRAGVDRVRFFETGEGVRASFDLAARTASDAFFLADPFRIVVDFDPRGVLPTEPTEIAADVARAVDVIVLDPGHGGRDAGAVQGSLREAELTLDLARRARDALRELVPRARVLLTRDADTFVPLEERVAIANAAGADLFVSIHLNSTPQTVDRGGVTTFVFDTSTDVSALASAMRENGTKAASADGIEAILASSQAELARVGSAALAERVQASVLAQGARVLPALRGRGVKGSAFYVLAGARMPAVLVEASFMTEPREARALGDIGYRRALASGLAQGIASYGGARPSLYPPRLEVAP